MDRSIWVERSVVVAAALVTAAGIGSFGIWEPWELVSRWSTNVAFDLFGVTERSARLPGVLAGLATGALTFILVRKGSSRRAAVIAVAVLASTPLFLLNARLSMGDAMAMAAQAWVGAAAFAASAEAPRRSVTALHYVTLCAGIAVSTTISGVLLGPLPPLLAVTVWSLMPDGQRAPPVVRWLFPGVALLMVAGVVRTVVRDAPEHSHWLGGGAVGGNPPTWDEALELVFHGFAPWSAALPVAATSMLQPRAVRSENARRLGWLLLLWAAFAFASWTVFASRYGSPPFLAAPALAGLVALWLDEVERERKVAWPASVVIALLTGLLIRDYLLYPDSPLVVLAAEAPSIPEVHHTGLPWTLVFTVASATLCLMLVSPRSTARPEPARIARWLEAQSRAEWPMRGWILMALGLLGACIAFGAMCFFLELPVASVVVRGGKVAFFFPFALAVFVFGLPWVQYGYGRLEAFHPFPVLATSLVVGAFIAFWFLPGLSQHFSPEPVYATYEALGNEDEPIAAYRVSTAAARYYTDAPIREIEEETALLSFLEEPGQRWAVVPADQLASLDRGWRRRTGEHVYVADSRSARLLLMAATPVSGRANQNVLPEIVLTKPPSPDRVVQASYDERIELIGYDLFLPAEDTVGAGQQFSVTWYWRVLRPPPAGYQVFVHIDGNGLRLNGDHAPAGGRYPVRLWESGDIIADQQTLTVPANFGPSDYAIYVGWFRGSKRLAVESGSNDGDDRVHAGALSVR